MSTPGLIRKLTRLVNVFIFYQVVVMEKYSVCTNGPTVRQINGQFKRQRDWPIAPAYPNLCLLFGIFYR